MNHCSQEAKPLQRFGGAAPKCRGLGKAQPPRCREFGGHCSPKCRRSGGAQPPGSGGLGGSARQVYSGSLGGQRLWGSLIYAVNRVDHLFGTVWSLLGDLLDIVLRLFGHLWEALLDTTWRLFKLLLETCWRLVDAFRY